MATPIKITRDNYSSYLVRSTNPRGSTPNGNVYFDTANDEIQLITLDELATVDLGSGAEANPFTVTEKMQDLALYFFMLEEVEADATLQNFRFAKDAVPQRMGKLVGATAFLNGIVLNGTDREKICDSGFGEYDVAGTLQAVYHGAKSLNPINSTTQPYYLLADSASEADRLSATPVDFDKLGDINSVIKTYENGGTDNRNDVLFICAREFGYTMEEANSTATGVAELGAYSQGYGIGNSIVSDIAALDITDVWTTPIVPYNSLDFYRYASGQAKTGFSTFGAGTTGTFTDEIRLSAGTMSILELRAWLDALMLSDADENANTPPVLRPKRMKPMYTINPANGKLVTRTGLYVDPAKLTAEAQQQIVVTDDSGGEHQYPFNSGITITVSDAWLADAAPWFRMLYASTNVGLNDYDTATAVTVPDASANPITEDGGGSGIDSRLSGNTISISYAYDTETAGGEVSPGVSHDVYFHIGGTDNSKRRTIGPVTITASSAITIDASTEAETN